MCLMGLRNGVPGSLWNCLRESPTLQVEQPYDFFSLSQLLFEGVFRHLSGTSFFRLLDPRSLPKWNSNGLRIPRKQLPTAFLKNIHRTIHIVFMFSFVIEKVNAPKKQQNTIQNYAFLRTAPCTTSSKKHKEQIGNHLQILQKCCPEVFGNRIPKRISKKHNKNRKHIRNI